MTSISGMSPADRIQQMLQTAVTSGTVKSADQSALSSAISDIDTQLQSGTKVSPSDIKSKVNGLVDQEVTDGKLTSDQADELKQVFAQASQAMGHHHGGHHMKVSGDSSATDITSTDPSTIDGSSTTSSTSTSGSSTTDSLTSSINTLMSFLQKLESATSSATNYTASGSSATSSAQSMLANLFA